MRWNAESVMRKVRGTSRMTDFRTPNAAHVNALLSLIGTDERTASVGGWSLAAQTQALDQRLVAIRTVSPQVIEHSPPLTHQFEQPTA